MSTGLSTTAANAALSAVLGSYTWIQLHVGDPGPNGTANVATNTTRKQVAWSTPSGGSASNTGVVTWTNVPASEDYTHGTAWSASTSGTFGFSGTVAANPVASTDDFDAQVGAIVVSIPVAS